MDNIRKPQTLERSGKSLAVSDFIRISNLFKSKGIKPVSPLGHGQQDFEQATATMVRLAADQNISLPDLNREHSYYLELEKND